MPLHCTGFKLPKRRISSQRVIVLNDCSVTASAICCRCVVPDAQATIQSKSVSRNLYKPSAGLEITGSAPAAQIEVKATEEALAFRWRAAVQMLGTAPASSSPEAILKLSSTEGIVNSTSSVQTVELEFDSNGLKGWKESETIGCRCHQELKYCSANDQ